MWPSCKEENALKIDEDEPHRLGPKFPLRGVCYGRLSQLTPFKQDPDDSRRRAAGTDRAASIRRRRELDALYDRLVKVRTAQARKMGYENYIELGCYRMGRNCYTQGGCGGQVAAVVKYLVPVATGWCATGPAGEGVP